MPTTLSTPEEFDSIVQQHEIVFVDFWAKWCAPCKTFGVIYEKIEQESVGILFTQVNVETCPQLAEVFEVQSIPHLLVFKKGIVIYSDSGSLPESALKDLRDQALALDVSKLLEDEA